MRSWSALSAIVIKIHIERDTKDKNIIFISRSEMVGIFKKLLSQIEQDGMKILAQKINQIIHPN